jgi:hypothetical protein
VALQVAENIVIYALHHDVLGADSGRIVFHVVEELVATPHLVVD